MIRCVTPTFDIAVDAAGVTSLAWVTVRTASAIHTGRRVHPFVTWPVLSMAALVAVLHCAATLFGRSYWFDEVYVLATGRSHLDWRSADQSPLTPALAALTDAIAPGSIFVLRLPAVAATAGAVVVAALIARELGYDRRAQVFVAAAQATMLWTTLAAHWLTPYALEPVQWMLLVWLMIRWQRVRDDRLLLAFGVVAGIAVLTKFQVILLCLVLLARVAALAATSRSRRRTTTPCSTSEGTPRH
ncbi:MAG: glycosyl transferase family 39 [Mycobacterium sp.]|nr:glycosyl transferase family 39 [Mycobacterium sp.]